MGWHCRTGVAGTQAVSLQEAETELPLRVHGHRLKHRTATVTRAALHRSQGCPAYPCNTRGFYHEKQAQRGDATCPRWTSVGAVLELGPWASRKSFTMGMGWGTEGGQKIPSYLGGTSHDAQGPGPCPAPDEAQSLPWPVRPRSTGLGWPRPPPWFCKLPAPASFPSLGSLICSLEPWRSYQCRFLAADDTPDAPVTAPGRTPHLLALAAVLTKSCSG